MTSTQTTLASATTYSYTVQNSSVTDCTLLIVSPVHPQDIRVGDVVTYQIRSGEPGVITHRVIAINSSTSSGRTFVFKGDNNSDRDPVDVVAGQIHGRVWYSVPLIGYVSTAVKGENKSWIIRAPPSCASPIPHT